MTDTNNQVGAGGGEETVTGAFIRGFGEGALDGLNQMGDAAFFKHFQRSGQLNHMPTAADGTPRPNGGISGRCTYEPRIWSTAPLRHIL